MAQPVTYRVPRRFIPTPEEPTPYGLVALSFTAHVLILAGALVVSTFLAARLDRSKIYIVNLVPSAPALGSPAARETRPAPAPRVEPPAPPRPAVQERTPPKPEAPPPPKVVERPPPRPERAVEPPPLRPAELTRAAASPRPAELALPRRVEKEVPVLDTPAARLERAVPPPPPLVSPPAPRVADALPRVTPPPPPPSAPAPAPAAPAPAPAVAARGPIEPVRLGRPTAGPPTTGSISLDVGDFPFTYYLRQIQAKIGERWVPPRAASAGGERTIVLFEIGRDGQIREPVLERSSGNALYDQSAIRAVTEASPFPPLPPEFKAGSLRVHFGFEYQPDQG
jgi:TonB family protein